MEDQMRDYFAEMEYRDGFVDQDRVKGEHVPRLPCSAALYIAIEELRNERDRTHSDRAIHLQSCIRTLEDIYIQRGMEQHSNTVPGEPWLTSVMDVAIFG
jgi:hypothetical protein